MESFRASGLSLFAKCRAAYKETKGVISPGSDPSREGQAKHKVAELIVAAKVGGVAVREAIDLAIVGLTAAEFGVSASLIEGAIDTFDRIIQIPEGATVHTEYDVELYLEEADEFVSGHPDLIIITEDEHGYRIGNMPDWKTGRNEQDEAKSNLQVIAYATASIKKFTLDEVRCYLVYTQLNQTDSAVFYKENLSKMVSTIESVVLDCVSEKPDYNVGEHCKFCSVKHTCPARHADLTPLLTGAEKPVHFGGLTAPEKALAVARIMVIRKMADEALTQMKADVDINGPIDLGNGKEYGCREDKSRNVDPALGWEVLSNRLGKHLPLAIKITLGKMEDAAILKYEDETESIDRIKGYKTKAKMTVTKELLDAGALTYKPKKTYTVMNKKKAEA